MLDTFFSDNPKMFIPALSIVCGCLIAVIAIIAHQWRRVRQLDIEGALKQDMLNRGLTPADIERVIFASTDGPPEQLGDTREAVSDNEYYLVEKLVEEGRSSEDIERIIKAFKSNAKPEAIKS